MVQLPVIGRWVRVRRWLRRYLGDVGYTLLVKGGAGVLALLLSYMAEQYFDPFGRKPRPVFDPPSPWIIEIERGK
jgi:hypothetical protein